MIVILAVDALEHSLVEKFDLANLKQKSYGKTNLDDFSEPRTMVLWPSILSGENKEKEVLSMGDRDMWNYKLPSEKTFFSFFKKHLAIDVPGYSQDIEYHNKERMLLKQYFDHKITVEEFDVPIFEHYNKIKAEFLEALTKDYDIVMGYVGLADVVGHLSFGIESKMKMIYREIDDLAKKAEENADVMMILSDHGMEAVGRYGDHSNHGFWSLNVKMELGTITPMHVYGIIKNLI